MKHAPITVAMTGASGAPYAVRLLEILNREGVPVSLVISDTGWRLLDEELDIKSEEQLRARTGDWSNVKLFKDNDRGATPASGSAPSRGMVVCPCSMGTLASIAQGTTRSLIERAADVCLKEGRRLVIVARETPLSIIHLENMMKLRQAGAMIVPAMPAFYHRPTDIISLIDHFIYRVMDHLGLQHSQETVWQGDARRAR